MANIGHKASKFRQGGIIVLVSLFILVILLNLRSLSINVWTGSIATGLCFALVALGVQITFRILEFPDMTIDGSFTLGAAITAAMIVGRINPYITLPVAFLGGALAGVCTAVIANRLKIHSLLASILTTTALLSINLRIMGRSNIPLMDEGTVFTPFEEPFKAGLMLIAGGDLLKVANNLLAILLVGFVAILMKFAFDWFMLTELGLAMQATGSNPQMIRSLGSDTNVMIVLGLAVSNGLVAFAGALFAQFQGFSDVNMGQGLIIAGLAAVIVGETIFRPRRMATATLAAILGMIIYRIAIAAALNIKLVLPGGEIFRVGAQDIKIATAAIVLLALWLSSLQKDRKAS